MCDNKWPKFYILGCFYHYLVDIFQDLKKMLSTYAMSGRCYYSMNNKKLRCLGSSLVCLLCQRYCGLMGRAPYY